MNATSKKFAPYFSRSVALQCRLSIAKLELESTSDELAEARRELEACTQIKEMWMKRALDEEFKAKRASGCYSHCPTFRPVTEANGQTNPPVGPGSMPGRQHRRPAP